MQTCITCTTAQLLTAELRYECIAQFPDRRMQDHNFFFSDCIVNFVKIIRSMSPDSGVTENIWAPLQSQVRSLPSCILQMVGTWWQSGFLAHKNTVTTPRCGGCGGVRYATVTRHDAGR
ncbi:hypothetical protein TNCV_3627341 [Trichonephila clavipes]|nr:hypothetical protein TNCV_3627341 [Trichonephila clavipes]